MSVGKQRSHHVPVHEGAAEPRNENDANPGASVVAHGDRDVGGMDDRVGGGDGHDPTRLRWPREPMASWAEFEAAEPEFASRVGNLVTSRKHLTMATLRSDGSPRISGTEVEFADGELRIGSMPRAVKAMDLRRDPRVAIHGPTNDPPRISPRAGKARPRSQVRPERSIRAAMRTA